MPGTPFARARRSSSRSRSISVLVERDDELAALEGDPALVAVRAQQPAPRRHSCAFSEPGA